MILVTSKQKVERKNDGFGGVNFFVQIFACGFLFTWHFNFDFVFFSICRGLVFCLVNEHSLNCTSGFVLLCFLFSRLAPFFVLHLFTQQS